jgi:8-oxo-dGTP diphosphatase
MTTQDKIHVLSRAVIIDQDHILLCQTQDLVNNFYFLPGGQIEHGESVTTALLRELLEETGAVAQIKRFLGCFEYNFVPGHNSICHNHEYNFIFEVESVSLKKDLTIPQLESHIKLTWQPMIDLASIDFRPAPLKEILPKWLNSAHNDAFQSVVLP